jgi:lysophospholipid acyltransferase (LPLAT)-like uncharacterized protein
MTASLNARVLALVAWILGRTWRLDVIGDEHVQGLRRRGIPIVFAVWHSYLLVPLWHRRGEGVTLLVSGHGDADFLAGAALRWGYKVVRGSSTRGGVGGLKGVLRVLASGGDAAFAPDGPRGPRGLAKPGTIAAATGSGASIVPVGAYASSLWRLPSWDRFAIPRPFSLVRLVYGRPLDPNSEFVRDQAGVDLLTSHLNVTQESAEC